MTIKLTKNGLSKSNEVGVFEIYFDLVEFDRSYLLNSFAEALCYLVSYFLIYCEKACLKRPEEIDTRNQKAIVSMSELNYMNKHGMRLV